MKTVEERCKKVMAESLEVEINMINQDSNPDTLDKWDSLGHVKLVLGLEKEFDLKILPEDGIEYFISFIDIVRYIKEKIK